MPSRTVIPRNRVRIRIEYAVHSTQEPYGRLVRHMSPWDGNLTDDSTRELREAVTECPDPVRLGRRDARILEPPGDHVGQHRHDRRRVDERQQRLRHRLLQRSEEHTSELQSL